MDKRKALLKIIELLRHKDINLKKVIWFEKGKGILVLSDLIDIEQAVNGTLEVVVFKKDKKGKYRKAVSKIKLTDKEVEYIAKELVFRYKRRIPQIKEILEQANVA